MYQAPRIPELTRRERFIRRVAAERAVFVVSDGLEIVRVMSRGEPPAPVALLWSARHEAERWADVLAPQPAIEAVGLGHLLDHLLPWLAQRGLAAGLDWTCDTVEPEIGALDLIARMRLEILDVFVHRVLEAGRMWILEGADGPASMQGRGEGTVALACWSEPGLAEAASRSEWAGMRMLEIPMSGFRDMTVPWLEMRGWSIAADPASTASAAEITPAALLHRLSQRPRAA